MARGIVTHAPSGLVSFSSTKAERNRSRALRRLETGCWTGIQPPPGGREGEAARPGCSPRSGTAGLVENVGAFLRSVEGPLGSFAHAVMRGRSDPESPGTVVFRRVGKAHRTSTSGAETSSVGLASSTVRGGFRAQPFERGSCSNGRSFTGWRAGDSGETSCKTEGWGENALASFAHDVLRERGEASSRSGVASESSSRAAEFDTTLIFS